MHRGIVKKFTAANIIYGKILATPNNIILNKYKIARN